VLRYGTPATSPGGEKEDDATGNRHPTCYDSKELLSDMIERGEPDMQWCERHRCDKQPKEYPQNDKGYPKISCEHLRNIVGSSGKLSPTPRTVIEHFPVPAVPFYG
jgi:hypothetical protein